MMRSLFSGVSGLKNHQTRMDVIGNNISNVNTTGFKSSRVNFTDMLSQTLSGASTPQNTVGGTNPKQIGLGSAVGAIDMLFTNGSVQSTGVNTDLALSSSNSLFLLETGTGAKVYTRNGDFQFDANGNYVQAGNGYFVRGWMADDSGELPTNKTEGNLKNIMIPAGKTMKPKESTIATYANNLDSEIPLINKISGGERVAQPGETVTVDDNSKPVTITTATGGNYVVTNVAGQSDVYDDSANAIPVDDDKSSITSFTPPTPGSGETLTVTLTPTTGTAKTATVTYDGTATTFTIPGTPPTTIKSNASLFTVGSTEVSDGTTTYTITKASVAGATVTKLSQAQSSYATTDQITATATNPVTITLNDGSTQQVTSGTYTVGESLPLVTTLSVYGTEGSVHEVPIYFTRVDAASNKWRVSLDNDGGSSTTLPDAAEIAKRTKVSLNSSELLFTDHGAFDDFSGNFQLTLLNGEQKLQTISLDLSQLTQYASSSTIAGKADGNAAGTLSSISIDKSGVITGTYTNGMKMAEAQVAVAQFNNPGGLTKIGESLYEESNNSGKPNVNTASALGATITPAALEMSNVDVANEFTDMIITQRGSQGNSKIITVSDEMLETLINMKR